MAKMEVNKSQLKLLKDLYFNPKSKVAYGSINGLYKAAKVADASIKLSQVKEWLK